LPEDLALAVLAHEAGHVYLHLQQYETHSMASRVEEGLCELFAYLWEHGRCVAGDVDWACHANNIDNCIGAIRSGDAAVRAIFEWVEERNAWNDTVVIVTSDHGHLFVLTDPAAFAK
jgi:membrane-anchored protein YejM (alkaline phosphatase superfamily)